MIMDKRKKHCTDLSKAPTNWLSWGWSGKTNLRICDIYNNWRCSVEYTITTLHNLIKASKAPIAQQKQASGGHWHLVIAADALISLSCPVVPPTTTHFLTTQWAPNYFSSNFKQRKSAKTNVGNPRQLIIWGLKVHHERIKRKQLESHLGYERCLELYSHGQEETSQAKMQWSPKLQSHTPSCLPFCHSLLHRSTAAPKPTSKGAYPPTSKAAFLLLHIYIARKLYWK